MRLNITGLTFDGIGVAAKIRRRAHFCFLSPEDAQAYAEYEDGDGDEEEASGYNHGENAADGPGVRKKDREAPIGGLIKEVKVESEIGQGGDGGVGGGGQTLRNVGKVERFVLEKVRSIFDDELVYPSFWTFLI